jgi:hypothetical protein
MKASPKLEAAIAAATKDLTLAVANIGSEAGKAYEAWILFSIVKALRARGLEVTARDHSDEATHEFRIKGGPGKIPNINAKGPQPCHFRVRRPGSPRAMELHVSIEHVGQSGQVHEVDISLVPHVVASFIRQRPNGGEYSGPRFACLELKNYANILDKNIARAFLGILLELHDGSFHMGNGDVWKAARDDVSYSLVTSAKVADPSVDLLSHYRMSTFAEVTPGASSLNLSLFLDRFSDWVETVTS